MFIVETENVQKELGPISEHFQGNCPCEIPCCVYFINYLQSTLATFILIDRGNFYFYYKEVPCPICLFFLAPLLALYAFIFKNLMLSKKPKGFGHFPI